MDHSILQKKKEIEKLSPNYITQKNFENGTFIIKDSGYYILQEDIIFDPDPDVFPHEMAFSLGFFAIIAISGKDIYLNLNGHSISATPRFVLQQRYFSIIELADAPFLPGQGPGYFSTKIISAENVIIENGTLGLSSHHGIHGNLAKNILLSNLIIQNFEFVGIALNGGESFFLKDITIGPNRQDIPVLATYSAARFARLFSKMALTKEISNELREKLESYLFDLENEMEITYNEVLNGKKISSDLFRNDSGLADGNIYGIVIKDKGVAVNDFVVKSNQKTKNVYLKNVKIKDMKCRVDEIITLSTKGGKGAITDVAGAVLQIDNITKDGIYRGTNLSDLQICLGEIAQYLKKSLGKNNISKDILDWVKNEDYIDNLLKKRYKYVCGGDSMFHFNKGAIGYRFDAIDNLLVKKCSLNNLINKGRLGNDKLDGEYVKSHSEAKRKGYCGSDSLGINVSNCSNVKIYKNKIEKIYSKNGDAIGINIINKSDVEIENSEIHNIKAGKLTNKRKWRGENYYGDEVKYKNILPNKIPQAVGIKITNSNVNLDNVNIYDLNSPNKPEKIIRNA